MSTPDPADAFAAFADEQRLCRLLQPHAPVLAPEAGAAIDRCMVSEAFFRAYANPASWPKATFSFRLRIAWRGATDDDTSFYAKVFLDGRGARVVDPHSLYLAALDMVVWRFPHDPKLVHLAALADPRRVRLPRGEPAVHVGLVKYTPEKCCTLRYRALGSPSETHYAKTYGDAAKAAAVYARLVALHDHQAVRSAVPLAHDATLDTIWTRAVHGTPPSRDGHFHDAGAALARLHRLDASLLEPVSTVELRIESRKKIAKLARACRTATPGLDRIAAAIDRGPGEPGPMRFLHGDFHASQLLVSDAGELCMFDFDSCAAGDPEQDAAEFIVAAHLDACPRAQVAAMLEGYHAAASSRLDPTRLRWHAHVQFVTRLYRHLRRLRPGWRDAITQSVTQHARLETLLTDLMR